MQITTIPTPMLKSNMYLVAENGHAIVIDPFDMELESLNSMIVDDILLTHEHYDHISGANVMRERFGCPIICGAVCGSHIEDATANFSRYFDAFCALQTGEKPPDLPPTGDFVCYADKIFSGLETMEWQGHTLLLMETPGHSHGSCCIVVDGNILFSGDTLLPTGKTITRFPGGNKKAFQSVALPFLHSLPKDTVVYPGHYDSFLLWEHEMLGNGTETESD